jgi:hypothetical protein
MLSISNATYIEPFKIALAFNNGTQGVMDFMPIISQDARPIFTALRDQTYFRQFRLQAGTVCWPNELDFAPEFLFFQLCKDKPEYQAQFRAWGYVESK